MKPVNFDYERPRTIDEVCKLLASNSNARILAGGQSLIPMLSMRLSRPSLLIDIAHIKDLSEIVATDTHIEIGAMVRQAVAKNAIMIQEYIPLLSKALHHVGHPPTRARGTVGGSIAHADPSAEIALVAVTLGAEITYRIGSDDHMFDATEFFIGPMLTVAPPDGCLVKVGFPKTSKICGTGFTRWHRAEAIMRLHPRRLKLILTQREQQKPSVLAWDLLEIFLSDLMLITY